MSIWIIARAIAFIPPHRLGRLQRREPVESSRRRIRLSRAKTKHFERGFRLRLVWRHVFKDTLRVSDQRPPDRRTAEQRYQLAPFGLRVDHKLVFCGLHHGHIGWLFTVED